jgi:hypothetical protein
MLNRSALVVRPKQPFLDWAAKLDDSGLAPCLHGEQTIYLIPEYDNDEDANRLLKLVFAEVFEGTFRVAHGQDGVAETSHPGFVWEVVRGRVSFGRRGPLRVRDY